jgi:hypothetical protein
MFCADFFFWIPTPCIPEATGDYEQLPHAAAEETDSSAFSPPLPLSTAMPIDVAPVVQAPMGNALLPLALTPPTPRSPSMPGSPATRRISLLAEAASPVPLSDEEWPTGEKWPI